MTDTLHLPDQPRTIGAHRAHRAHGFPGVTTMWTRIAQALRGLLEARRQRLEAQAAELLAGYVADVVSEDGRRVLIQESTMACPIVRFDVR